MTGQVIIQVFIAIGLLLADLYIFKALKSALKWRFLHTQQFDRAYWILSFLLVIGLFLSIYVNIGVGPRAAIMLAFFLLLICKVALLPFLLIDDLRMLLIRVSKKQETVIPETAAEKPVSKTTGNEITRSEFLVKAGLIAGAVPLAGMGIGMVSGAYDYHVRRVNLYLPNLPKKFDGIRLGQISDIHSGSFYNKKAVMGGIEMLLKEKPDFIFFTGDLVNARTDEMYGYQDMFSKVKAPLGVYSSLGNHDYGDYYRKWVNEAAKKKNLQDLKDTHKRMGWHLLANDNTRLKVDGEEIGILGVENWGLLSRFPKYGRMDLTTKNTDDLPVKLLLSHDPSHWRAEILAKYPQIDATFAGHTHGMQFGVRTESFQWSPIEYIYKEWAGLYREGRQQLYVNVGYGFLGYPGRVGILPEITIFELKAMPTPINSPS